MSDNDDNNGDTAELVAAITSNPPPSLDNGYVRKTLTEIKKAQATQAIIEAKRAGASSFRAKVAGLFGSIFAAAVIGGFVWVLDVQSQGVRHEGEIERIEERAHQHTASPHASNPVEPSDIVAVDRRVDGVDRAQKAINERLDRHEAEGATRHVAILEELRRLRTASRNGRTWGGGR